MVGNGVGSGLGRAPLLPLLLAPLPKPDLGLELQLLLGQRRLLPVAIRRRQDAHLEGRAAHVVLARRDAGGAVGAAHD